MPEVKVTRISPPSRRPAWDWDAPSDLSGAERAELEALQEQVPRLEREVGTLRGEIADTAAAAEHLRDMLRAVVRTRGLERRRLLRRLRDTVA